MSTELTTQQVFDRVVDHARKQGRPAIEITRSEFGTPQTTCKYRAPDGGKCFVGALISDECYRPEFERKVINTRIVREALIASGVPANTDHATLTLLGDMQNLHDKAAPAPLCAVHALWENGFRRIAREYKLKYTPPTEQP